MGIGILLGFFLKLFIFTAYLSTEQIGLLTVLLDVANLLAAFIPLGSQSIFVRFLPHFKENNSQLPKGLLFIGSILSLGGFLLFALLFLIFKEDISGFYINRAPMLSKYIYLLLPLVFARVIFVVGMGYARALKKNVFPLIIKEIIVRVFTGILIVGFASHLFNLDGLVLCFVGIYFLSGTIMTYYIFHHGSLILSPSFEKLKNGKGREILYFGLFAVLTSAGEIIIRNIDSLMLTSIKGLAATGVYSVAFFIGQIIDMPRRALSQITAPFVSEAAARQDKKTIASLYQKSSVNQFLIGSLLLICVWTNIDSLLEIIPNGSNYINGKYVVLFIGLGKLFDMSMGINSNIIQNSTHYRFNFYAISLLATLGIVTNLMLIPILGINGAAIASFFSISLVNIGRAVFIKYRFGLQPFGANTIMAVLISGICYIAAILLPDLESAIWDIIYRSIIVILLFAILSLRSKVSQDLNKIFEEIVKKTKALIK